MSHFRKSFTLFSNFKNTLKVNLSCKYIRMASNSTSNIEPVMMVHGGFDDILDWRKEAKIRGIKEAVKQGYRVLKYSGSVLDAVEAAVRTMEDNAFFNAGYGSVLNSDGEVEMDASIMYGSDLNAGAVSAVKDIAHPISLARLIMERTPHVTLTAEGAKRFAASQGMEILPQNCLVTDFARDMLKQEKEKQDSHSGGSCSKNAVEETSTKSLGEQSAFTILDNTQKSCNLGGQSVEGNLECSGGDNSAGGPESTSVGSPKDASGSLPRNTSGSPPGSTSGGPPRSASGSPPGSSSTVPKGSASGNKPGSTSGSPPGSTSGGTVGAVALDCEGHVAAATSTGGLTGKIPGRVGDSCVIGCGTYADDVSGAVSVTGHGESILKFCLAHSICKEMENGKTAEAAAADSISRYSTRLHNVAGVITVSRYGDVGVSFNSDRMVWAYIKQSELHFGVEPGQDDVECVNY